LMVNGSIWELVIHNGRISSIAKLEREPDPAR
jgi:hypothetical protein